MKTVKEYANSVGKSHQSVYKQLNSKKNKERLEIMYGNRMELLI